MPGNREPATTLAYQNHMTSLCMPPDKTCFGNRPYEIVTRHYG